MTYSEPHFALHLAECLHAVVLAGQHASHRAVFSTADLVRRPSGAFFGNIVWPEKLLGLGATRKVIEFCEGTSARNI